MEGNEKELDIVTLQDLKLIIGEGVCLELVGTLHSLQVVIGAALL